MKGRLVAFGNVAGREAAALLENGRLDDLLIDPPEDRIRPGAIYRAKASRAMKGQGGAMLDTPDGKLFLRQSKGLAAGLPVIVQVTGHAEAGKAPPATQKLVFKSRFVLATPGAPGVNLSRDIRDDERRVELRELLDGVAGEGEGLVVRSAAADGDDDAILADAEAMLEVARAVASEPVDGAPELLLDGPGARDLAWREWNADGVDDSGEAFEALGVLDSIDALLVPEVHLESGGRMWIEATRAIVAVDVDTGGDTSPAAALKANLAMARDLPRQLRLRGLGGQIAIDPAPMPKGQRRQVDQALRAAFRRDPIETALVGWTTLGLIELQRKRERVPLAQSIGKEA